MTNEERGRWPGDADKVAVVLPGGGYTPDMSLLYWTARVLNSRGWTVQPIWWHDRVTSDRGQWKQWVESEAKKAIERESAVRELLIVGKSLGSFAIPYAAARSIRGIWLTPIISASRDPHVDRDALLASPPSLLVGGTGDPTWDSEVAHASGHTVFELEGADHSLELEGDPQKSVGYLADVVAAIDAFIT